MVDGAAAKAKGDEASDASKSSKNSSGRARDMSLRAEILQIVVALLGGVLIPALIILMMGKPVTWGNIWHSFPYFALLIIFALNIYNFVKVGKMGLAAGSAIGVLLELWLAINSLP